jgi:hypothetical protein
LSDRFKRSLKIEPTTRRSGREGAHGFEIELDGKPIGTIAYSETVEAEIDAGHHVLKGPVGPVLEPRPFL